MMNKFNVLSAVFLLMTALMACQERPNINEIEAKLEKPIETESKTQSPTSDALKALDQTLSTNNKILTAKDIKFDVVAYQYDLPDSMKQVCGFDGNMTDKETGETIDFCTEIDVKLAKVEPVWIEHIVNKQITNDDSPKLLKFKQTLDDFVGEHLAYINEIKEYAKENNEAFTSAPLYSWTAVPELLPSINNVVQVVISSDTYMGGAHGVPSAEYLLFDMDLQSQINLYDVLEKNKETEFYELAMSAFKNYLKNELELSPKEIKEYQQNWEFKLSENFYFDGKGLVLVYQPYEMGSFAQGFIELVISYEQLKVQEVLKPQYLPQ